MKVCQCTVECDDLTAATFAVGHDARYRERMLRLLRERRISIDEVRYLTADRLRMPGLFRQIEEKLELGQVA